MKKITLFLVVFLILTCFGNVFTGVAFADTASKYKIGRASCRERECEYV